MTRKFRQILSETWHGLSHHGAAVRKEDNRPCPSSSTSETTTEESFVMEEMIKVPTACPAPPPPAPRSELYSRLRHRVRFRESQNEMHSVDDTWTHVAARWYNKDDIEAFKKETFRTAQVAMQQAVKTSLSQGSWSKLIRHSYYVLTTVGSTADQHEKLWEKTDHCLDATHVGLHQWAFPDLKRDRLRRREELQRCVQTWKTNKSGGEALAQSCRQITQPSRQFALYLGKLVAN